MRNFVAAVTMLNMVDVVVVVCFFAFFLHSQDHRSVYLITYSQANLEIFQERQDFADAILEAFSQSNVPISLWVCSRELHTNGGSHCRMAIKMERSMRWLPMRNYLSSKFHINVNFSNRHVNYYTAWQ